MPPVKSRCAYLPENFFAYDAGSGCGAPLASPSSVMVGTADHRSRGELLSKSSYFGSPSASPSRQR